MRGGVDVCISGSRVVIGMVGSATEMEKHGVGETEGGEVDEDKRAEAAATCRAMGEEGKEGEIHAHLLFLPLTAEVTQKVAFVLVPNPCHCPHRNCPHTRQR